jgi:hypothetical protein
MESETKNCQNCKKDFVIEPEDFNYYEKIKVPPPTWCPECRFIRRFLFQNTWNLCWHNCDKCGNKTLSMFLPQQKMIVYCQSCWWKDDWDGTEYGMDYDLSRSFLEQVKELIEKTPHVALENQYLTLKNSEYVNAVAFSRDCHLVFWADYCESVYYSSILNGLKFSSDCLRGWESELCYESTGFIRSYRVFFSEEFDDCMDVWFSRNCYGCSNCIGCVNLRGASYQIFNVQYSKDEYAKKLKELGLDSWKNIRTVEKQAREFWLTKPYREYHGHSFNLNVNGEYVFLSKNSKESYILNYAENCKWCQFITVPTAKDCYDYSGWGNNASRIYESVTVGENADSVYFSTDCWPDALNLQYCYWTITGKNCLGCVNLKRKKYCILNKEYSKEAFEKLQEKIIEDMKINPYIDSIGRKYFYGEFFPPEFSRFSYNKSNAMRFFQKTKEQVIKEGYGWENTEGTVYKISKKANFLLEKIADTGEDILNEVIECENCGKGYKIVQGEYDLLRKINLPIPHECPRCRESRRFARLNKPGLYNRICAKCNADIYTPYAPERPEIVYCVKCYQQEFS